MNDEPPVDYKAMSGPKLIEACADDARAWAQAFMQIAHHAAMTSGQSVVDEAYMIGWFANAIEAACAKRTNAMREELDRLRASFDKRPGMS